MAIEEADRTEINGLVAQMAEAASAFIGGDIRQYMALMSHSSDFTLMPPTGGEPRRNVDHRSEAAVAAMEAYFRGGDAELEVFETYASGDLAVLVVIERQHGLVGERPEQDWSLRVTLVFRRDDSGWHLAHRHADPLVHPISEDQLASLARG